MVALLFALTGAVGAWACTRFVKEYVPGDSRLLRFRVHVILAALFGVAAPFVAQHPAELVGFIAAGVGCALLVVVDMAVHRLPDKFVVTTFAALLVSLGVAAATQQQWATFGRALLIALLLVTGYFILAFINPAGLGLGDVKFAAVIGLFLGWFGWSEMAVGTVLGFILNGLAAIALVIRRRKARDQEVAFGPSMVLGAILALVVSQ